MKYKVDGWNNFCRVFELPEKFPPGFCFGGGIATEFRMVDWFNPIAGLPTPLVSKEKWREKCGEIDSKVDDYYDSYISKVVDHDYLCKELVSFLLNKQYIKPERTYLIYCNFGACFTFGK